MSLDKKQQTDVIIMAFDVVPHNRLTCMLNLDLTTMVLRAQRMTGFLTYRQQRVVVGGDHSDWVQVQSGVPQGTAPGPLLFLLYINDLPDNITSTDRLFTDD